MLKVLKFGGSSMADAHQLEKVRSIVEADPARRVVVVSAAGKRFKDDHKITDLLYLCHAHLQYGVSCDGIFDMVRSRYLEIRDELGLSTPLEAEFDALRAKMDKGISADELVSRGEYFAARIMADCLGFDFLDSSLWLHFRMDGTVDQEASYQALVHAASGRKVVIPGFYDTAAELQESSMITGIAGKKGFSVITMTKNGMSSELGVIRRVLEILERYHINVEYIPSGIDSVSLVVEAAKAAPYLYQALGDMEKEIKPDSLHVTDGMAVVAAVGRKMAFQPGSSGKIFAKLGENGINIRMITQGPEELNIIVGVDSADFEKAIRVLYNSFVK